MTIKYVKLVEKKEFVATVLDLDNETFIVYIAFFASSNQSIDNHFFYRVQIASLIVDEIAIVVLFKYADFVNIFSLDFVVKFLKYMKINSHPIN